MIVYNKSVQKKPAMTIETTYSQAREQLKTLMDRAVDDRETIIVRRRTGGDVAMIAADELASLIETAHLLHSPKNAQRLLSALNRARTETQVPTDLAQLQTIVGFDA
jgi:antitoxin YefM